VSTQLPREESILGLDNVRLDLPIAGVGTRVLAGFVDYLLVLALNVAWVAACIGAVALVDLGMGWAVGLVLVGFFVLEYGYFAGMEIWLGGQTAGKRVVGLRVVTRQGGRPGTPALLLRNAVRTVDNFVGVPLMMIDTLSRRVGDRLAGTVVVHQASGAPELVVHRVPRGWSPGEVALLESFIRRHGDLETERADQMARSLLTAIARDDATLLEGIPEHEPPLERLRRAVDARTG
jgi:uncharacterized RDD family membrane protein YckC